MAHAEETAQPPQPPEIEPKFTLSRVQWIGLPLLMLLPLLALLGVFGESFTAVADSNDVLDMEVEYATRYRYKMRNALELSLENLSAQTIPTLTVRLDADYISQFSDIAFSPQLDEITDEDYIVHLQDVQPGEVRVVTVEMQGDRYGRHSGTMSATAGGDGNGRVQVEVATFIFP
jgi:hypothetical protein